MKPVPHLLSALALSMIAFTGCLGPRAVHPPALYVLAPAPSVERVEAAPITLGIRPVAVAKPYGVAMAHLNADGRMGYRVEEQWSETPGAVVTRALTDALAATDRFADVGNAAEMARPDLLLTGEVRQFHEDRAAGTPAAVFSVRLELRPARDPGMLWAETIAARVEFTGDGPGDFAKALERAIADAVAAAVAAISAADLPES